MDELAFKLFIAPLLGLPISHVWRGHGSALFLEFGALRQNRRRDGHLGEPTGEMSLMIEWSWRIEGRRRIICGSWSEERLWPRVFALLKKRTVTNVNLFGRLPELDVEISNGVHLLSFMTSEGNPSWTIFDRRADTAKWLHVRHGQLQVSVAKP
jgi:hypothetical protein